MRTPHTQLVPSAYAPLILPRHTPSHFPSLNTHSQSHSAPPLGFFAPLFADYLVFVAETYVRVLVPTYVAQPLLVE